MGWWVLKRRLHQSWLLAAVGLGALIGCAITQSTGGLVGDCELCRNDFSWYLYVASESV